MDRRQFIVGTAAVVGAASVLVPAAPRAQTVRVRRNVMTMAPNDPFFSDYARAITLMHQLPSTDQRNWRNQALIHLNHCPHGAQDFVHWHRHYINFYEQIIGQLIGKPDFALAYWDWSYGTGIIPNPFYDVNALNVTYWKDPSNAQSNNWGPYEVTTTGVRILARGSGVQQSSAGGAFTPATLQSILNSTVFTNFTRSLEGTPHNNGHVVVGGSQGHMGDGMSPLDPIFWLHHCMVDYMWAAWQGKGNTTPPLSKNYDGQFVNGQGQPMPANSADSLDYSAMGYRYEGLTPISAPALMASARTNRRAAPVARTLASSAAPVVVSAPRITTLPLSATTTARRSLMAATPTSGTASRTLANIIVGSAPTIAPMVINVFLNNPAATAQTPYTDPSYVGSFSFFSGHRNHAMPMTYTLDMSATVSALAAAGKDTGKLELQLVPVMVAPYDGAPPTFTVNDVKITRS